MNSLDSALIQKANQFPIYAIPPDAAFKKLEIAIIKICTEIGIKTMPDILLKQSLIAFIQGDSRFRNLSIEGFMHAFDLNAAGHYDKIYEHYDCFNKMFVGQVLNQYMIKREEAFRSAASKSIQLPPPSEPTPEELEKEKRQCLKVIARDFENFKQDPSCTINAVKFKVQLLEEYGVLKISNEEKWEWYNKAVKQHATNLKVALTEKSILFTSTIMEIIKKCEAGEAPTSEDTKIKSVARELALRHYFGKWKEESYDLQKALNV